jgi:hypothetical protein
LIIADAALLPNRVVRCTPYYGGGAATTPKYVQVRLLVFDDPALSGRYEWLVDERDDVHAAMRALARQAYRRNRRHPPEDHLHEQLRAHGSVDAHPYVPPAAA